MAKLVMKRKLSVHYIGTLKVVVIDGPETETADDEVVSNIVEQAYQDATRAFKERLQELRRVRLSYNEGQNGVKYEVEQDG